MPEDTQDFRDKTRMCPSCRMEISFFATKCRFCGEGVGRPKEEVRQLTIHDLGGERGADYAPNEDVVDAIEQFRKEEMARSEPPVKEKGGRKSGRFGHGHSAPPSKQPEGDTLDSLLDPQDSDMSSLREYTPRRRPSYVNEPSWTKRVVVVGLFVALALVLFFWGGAIKSGVQRYLAQRNAKPVAVIENRAIEILERGGSKIDALQEAVRVQSAADTPENRKILDRVRKEITQDVDSLLNAERWEHSMLGKASKIASQAADIDHNPAMTALKDRVDNDVYAYSLMVKELDSAKNEVVLLVSAQGQSPDTVIKKVGDSISNRFTVKGVTRDFVRLEDSLRKTSSGRNRQFCLYRDGTIRLQ